ncbi:MAG: cellulase family glycosylhydrolase [Planctomycetes bacterium]|nr:cellulase family glycosylhydrolase [Planctomycetota bacterium]MBI5557983.1 cellulase family glycosylhydrolase [Deltaproteobacteria bacterium]
MKNKLGLFTLVFSLLIFNTTSWSVEQKQGPNPVTGFRLSEVNNNSWGAEQSQPPNWPWRGIDTHSCCGGTGPEDIALLAGLNVNAVMLNLKVRFQTKQEKISPELSWAKNLAWADSMLDACRKHGITGNIRLNEIPIDPAFGLTERSVDFWNSPARYNEAVKFAGQLAEHFKSRGSELGAYTILSEPTVSDGKKQSRPAVWPRLQQEIIDAIRKHDKTRFIVVTPGPGGMPGNYSSPSFKPFADPRIIYGAHMYGPHAYTHQGIDGRPTGVKYPGKLGLKKLDKEFLTSALQPLKNFQQQHNALVWIGEFSAVTGAVGAELYLSDLMTIFDNYGWSWTYFTYKDNPLWDPSNDENIRKISPEHPLTSLTTPRWEVLKSAFDRNNKD